MEAPSTTDISFLPEEMRRHVTTFLGPSDKTRLSMVNTGWLATCNSIKGWTRLEKRTCPFPREAYARDGAWYQEKGKNWLPRAQRIRIIGTALLPVSGSVLLLMYSHWRLPGPFDGFEIIMTWYREGLFFPKDWIDWLGFLSQSYYVGFDLAWAVPGGLGLALCGIGGGAERYLKSFDPDLPGVDFERGKFTELDEQVDWERCWRVGPPASNFCNRTGQEKLEGFKEFIIQANLLHEAAQSPPPDLHPAHALHERLTANLRLDWKRSELRGETEWNAFCSRQPIQRYLTRCAPLVGSYRKRLNREQRQVLSRYDWSQYNADRRWYATWHNRPIEGLGKAAFWGLAIVTPVTAGYLFGIVCDPIVDLICDLPQLGSWAFPVTGAASVGLLVAWFYAWRRWGRHLFLAPSRAAQEARNYVETFDPDKQYPNVKWKQVSFAHLNQAGDWNRVLRYGLVELHLLQIAVLLRAKAKNGENVDEQWLKARNLINELTAPQVPS